MDVFMAAESTAFGMHSQPHSVGKLQYRIRMSDTNTRKQLWENVSALMRRRYGGENLTRLAKEAKVGPGSATRLKEQRTSVGIDILDKLARLFKVEPWQLLAPGLDERLPSEPAATPWPIAWRKPSGDRRRRCSVAAAFDLMIDSLGNSLIPPVELGAH
jgi:transcriptional regulator with XRE-family HTH domain